LKRLRAAGARSTRRTSSPWSEPGATFCKGKLIERPTDEDAEVMVA
jgi:hypothetical protein